MRWHRRALTSKLVKQWYGISMLTSLACLINNTEKKTADQIENYYAPSAFRASDHDPVIVTFNLGAGTDALFC